MTDSDKLIICVGFLKQIKQEGVVCGEFETCDHAACNSSYSAWVLADAALKAIGEDSKGKKPG